MMEWLGHHARPVVDSILYAVVGSLILLAAFWIISKMLPFSLEKEIAEDQNTSLGIILGALILGLSIIIASAIK